MLGTRDYQALLRRQEQGEILDALLDGLRAGGVDVLVTDLDMPKLDGRQLLDRLTEITPMPATVVISGYLDPVVEEELRGHAAVRHVLRKPFDVVAFAGLVAGAARTDSTTVGGL